MLMYANVFLMGLSLVKQVVVTPGLLNSFYPNVQWYLKRHKLEERFLTWISTLTALKLPPQVCVGVSLHLDFSLNFWHYCPPATDGVRGTKKKQLPSNASDFWTINILTHYSCSISHGFMVRKYKRMQHELIEFSSPQLACQSALELLQHCWRWENMLNPEDSATQETAANKRQASPWVSSHKFMHLTKGAVGSFHLLGISCGQKTPWCLTSDGNQPCWLSQKLLTEHLAAHLPFLLCWSWLELVCPTWLWAWQA